MALFFRRELRDVADVEDLRAVLREVDLCRPVSTALHAGEHDGFDRLDELTLHAPLILAEHTPVQVQISVGAAEKSGLRPVLLYSRVDDGQPWTRHATGTLAQHGQPIAEGLAQWPPAGATALDIEGFYERLAETGFCYGPSFRGLRAAWRRAAGCCT